MWIKIYVEMRNGFSIKWNSYGVKIFGLIVFMHLKHKYLHFILISLIIILLSSCSRLPKNPSSQNKTVLVVKTDLINSSKHNVQTRFKFKINSNSGALDEF